MNIKVGIAPNIFLAKQAANWHKSNGIDQIDHRNLIDYYKDKSLTDLTGIAERNEARLNAYNILTPLQFLAADEYTLKKRVFGNITGIYCYQLEPSKQSQPSMFEDTIRAGDLTKAVDEINDFYGAFTIYSATAIKELLSESR